MPDESDSTPLSHAAVLFFGLMKGLDLAGDWIKMRSALCTHPKVIRIAEIVGDSIEIGKKLSTGFNGSLSEIVTSDVTRDVTLASLLRVWSATNEHTDDGVWKNSTLKTLDSVAGIPSFGEAMELVGWAVYDSEANTVTLPDFLENNAPAKRGARSSAAERQARYRENKRQKGDVTRDVTRDVTSNAREEKRREREEKRVIQTQSLTLPDWLPVEPWNDYVKHRGSKFTHRAKELALDQLRKMVDSGHDPTEILQTSVANGWKGLFEPKGKGLTNGYVNQRDSERREVYEVLTGRKAGANTYDMG